MAVVSPAVGKRSARRILKFLKRQAKTGGPMLIATHDHPDPDALASAWALQHLAHSIFGIRSRIAFGGMVGRRENRLMIESLWIPAFQLRRGDLDAKTVVLVDTQPPFRNNRFSIKRRWDLIIDHHPKHAKTRSELLLIDEGVGATATILAEALLEAKVKVPSRLATAIVYGIGSETQNLGREASPRDRAAYMAFVPKANMKQLWRIANPPRPASFFQTLSRAITNAFVSKRTIGVHLREVFSPDRVAQMADFLLTHEKMMWSIVTGRYGGKLHISLRTTNPNEDAGRLLRRLLGGGNRGGGHRMIAGGSVKVGRGASESKWRKAEERVVADFLASRGTTDPKQSSFPFRNHS